jgi:hypothetical protein
MALLEATCAYCVIGQEVGESGTPHLQGYIYFGTLKSLPQLRALNPRAHYEMARGTVEENFAYCTKDGNFEERGVRPATQAEKGAKGAARIKELWKLAKQGSFESLPPQNIKTWEYIHSKYRAPPADRCSLTNYWIVGKSGCGKSSACRRWFSPEQLYWKGMSKWWDGYNHEQAVVLDDMEPTHGKFLSYYVKIWCDHYPFNAEVKGGMIRIRPEVIIVTSNFTIDEVFAESEPVTRAAIRRRFKVLDFDFFKDYETLPPIGDAVEPPVVNVVSNPVPTFNSPEIIDLSIETSVLSTTTSNIGN